MEQLSGYQYKSAVIQLPREKSVQVKQVRSGKNGISESLFSLSEESNFADRFSFGFFFFAIIKIITDNSEGGEGK